MEFEIFKFVADRDCRDFTSIIGHWQRLMALSDWHIYKSRNRIIYRRIDRYVMNKALLL